jgi:hypothetical protein
VRSIYLQKDKTIFKLDDLPLEAFATSLGLAGAPKIKFVRRRVRRRRVMRRESRMMRRTRRRRLVLRR